MSESSLPPPTEPLEAPQALTGFMTNAEWDELLGEVGVLLRNMDELPYPNVKEQVFALLAGIDTIHREALRRLVRLFKEGVMEKVVTDPAIHTLMELYDLLPPEEKVADPQRAKIIFTTARSKAGSDHKETPPVKPKYPHWVPVAMDAEDVVEGAVQECHVEDSRILLCRVGGALFAIDAACDQDGSSLSAGSLSKFTLSCPNHSGCYYDVRHGARIAASGRIACYPVKQNDGGRIMVGVDMEFSPKLPSF